MGDDKSDLREFKRFPIDLDVKFRVLAHGPSQHIKNHFKTISANSKNVSENGLFISCDTLFDEGTMLEFSITRGELNSETKLLGKVCWKKNSHEGQGMGIKIMGVSEEDFLKIIDIAKRGGWIKAE